MEEYAKLNEISRLISNKKHRKAHHHPSPPSNEIHLFRMNSISNKEIPSVSVKHIELVDEENALAPSEENALAPSEEPVASDEEKPEGILHMSTMASETMDCKNLDEQLDKPESNESSII